MHHRSHPAAAPQNAGKAHQSKFSRLRRYRFANLQRCRTLHNVRVLSKIICRRRARHLGDIGLRFKIDDVINLAYLLAISQALVGCVTAAEQGNGGQDQFLAILFPEGSVNTRQMRRSKTDATRPN